MSEQQTQTVRGTVVKKSSAQTIRVAVKFTKIHPIYKKRYSRTRYYLAHDPADTTQVGDEVTLVSCRPISKLKSWTIKG
jgi:small subunit ribosomal protein S17